MATSNRERAVVNPAANPLPVLGDPAELDDDARRGGAARVASGWIDRPAAPPLPDAPPRRRLTVTQGELYDLRTLGEVVHLGSGYLLRLDRTTGQITAHHRGTGDPVDAEIRPPRVA